MEGSHIGGAAARLSVPSGIEAGKEEGGDDGSRKQAHTDARQAGGPCLAQEPIQAKKEIEKVEWKQ